jgi:hypothetical protein
LVPKCVPNPSAAVGGATQRRRHDSRIVDKDIDRRNLARMSSAALRTLARDASSSTMKSNTPAGTASRKVPIAASAFVASRAEITTCRTGGGKRARRLPPDPGCTSIDECRLARQILSGEHFVRRAFKTKLSEDLSTSCRATTGTR